MAREADSEPRPLPGVFTILAGAGHTQLCRQAITPTLSDAKPIKLQQAVGSECYLYLLPPAHTTQHRAEASRLDSMHAGMAPGCAAALQPSLPRRDP